VTEREAKQQPAADAAALRGSGDWFGRALAEGARNSAGVVDDYLAAVAPWGFAPADVAVPTHVYQGTDDSLVPPGWGARLAAAIPGAELTEYQHEGHMIAVSHRGDVVRDLIA
jgi:pimeloyl-ACP methyl ester carboxylesterase